MAFAGVGRTAVGASRSLARPTRRRLRALVVVVAPGHWSGAARCVLGQWPAASHVVCAPAHPCASPLRGISPARCPSAPRGGSLSPRALVVCFCYKFRSWSRTGYGGYRPKRPVSQRGRWLTFHSKARRYLSYFHEVNAQIQFDSRLRPAQPERLPCRYPT